MAPICLLRGDQLQKPFVGSIVEVAGWGITNIVEDMPSDYLLFVKLPILPIEICINLYKKITQISQEQTCAGGVSGKDSCGGDSGGPAMLIDTMNSPPRYYLFGLVSFGPTKCGTAKPAVYTRAASYMMWLMNSLRP